jgi:outer membrane protein assembly factor BamB
LKLYRLNAANGSITWQKDLVALYSGSVIAWQNAASPLIENGLIYVNGNCGTQRLLALRTSDGSLAWRSQNEGMTHATPVLATIHGVRQVIFATQGGLVSVDPLTGARLWKATYPYSYATSLAVSPVVHEDLLFVSGAQAYGMRGAAMRVTFTNNIWSTAALWNSTTLASHWMTPVCFEGHLYGLFGNNQYDNANAQLKCVDLLTGVERWSTNGFGCSGIALVDKHLVVLTERGQLVLAKPVTNAYTELGRFLALPDYHSDTNKCWNSPAVADGRVYVRSTYYGAAFDLAVPNLTLEAPLTLSGGRLQLKVRAADGSPWTPIAWPRWRCAPPPTWPCRAPPGRN